MDYVLAVIIVVICYVIGSIPFGLIIVRIASGKDVRKIGSGRIGGTNVMRAAGWLAGVITALLDVLKGVASGWICVLLLPGNNLVKVIAAIATVVGSIHSIFSPSVMKMENCICAAERGERPRWAARSLCGVPAT